MSNRSKEPTREVKFRHQTLVQEIIEKAFLEECQKRRWKEPQLLRVILEERYGQSDA